MNILYTVDILKEFEKDIADSFQKGLIPYPVHFDGGNEHSLINYFDTQYMVGDWVVGTWRMHYKCLLAGVPAHLLREAIFAGHSITLCFPEYKIFSTALVGHGCSIAVGIAHELKGTKNKVHCFLGDMAHTTGDFHESHRYAVKNSLPVSWVVEDNQRSVTTNTREVWGRGLYTDRSYSTWFINYEPTYPHQGTGKRVEF